MKILRFNQNTEYKQLGIDGKVLYIKVEGMLEPMKLGTLHDIKSMEDKASVSVAGKSVQMAEIAKKALGQITSDGLKLADSFTNEEFYKDFLQDFKQMSREPNQFMFIGEATKWD